MFNLQQALQCPKGRIVTLRHNNIRNRTANFLTEFCKDVRVGPQLQPLSSEIFPERTANRFDNNGVRVVSGGEVKKTQQQTKILTKNFAMHKK